MIEIERRPLVDLIHSEQCCEVDYTVPKVYDRLGAGVGVSKASSELKAKKPLTRFLQFSTLGNIEATKSYRNRIGSGNGVTTDK